MKQTPLYGRHKALGAKVIDFGGWAMPVQYSGILDEHKAVRSACGLFDVSHMGEVDLHGPRAAEAVQRLVTNDVGQARRRQAMYSCACRPIGRHRRRSASSIATRRTDFLIVVNASQRRQGLRLVPGAGGRRCATWRTLSDAIALLAVQGPRAVALVQSLSKQPVGELKSFHHAHGRGRRRARRASRAPATPARTASRSSWPTATPSGCGTRSWTRRRRSGSSRSGSARATRLRLEARAVALRQRPRRGAHAARGGPVVGGQGQGLHRRGGARPAEGRGRGAQARRLRHEGARHRPPRLLRSSTRAASPSAS